MIVFALLVAIVFVGVLRWRLGHAARRKSEAIQRQQSLRPLGEWEARFPADRRLSNLGKRSRKSRLGL